MSKRERGIFDRKITRPALPQATIVGKARQPPNLIEDRRQEHDAAVAVPGRSVVPFDPELKHWMVVYGDLLFRDRRRGKINTHYAYEVGTQGVVAFASFAGVDRTPYPDALSMMADFECIGVATNEDLPHQHLTRVNGAVSYLDAGSVTVPNRSGVTISPGDKLIALPPHHLDKARNTVTGQAESTMGTIFPVSNDFCDLKRFISSALARDKQMTVAPTPGGRPDPSTEAKELFNFDGPQKRRSPATNGASTRLALLGAVFEVMSSLALDGHIVIRGDATPITDRGLQTRAMQQLSGMLGLRTIEQSEGPAQGTFEHIKDAARGRKAEKALSPSLPGALIAPHRLLVRAMYPHDQHNVALMSDAVQTLLTVIREAVDLRNNAIIGTALTHARIGEEYTIALC